jgi:hypothetical protein
MNCWEILGIDPTGDRAAIDRAYEQQKKFAAGEELSRLDQAYREASGEQPGPEEAEQPAVSQPRVSSDAELTAEERQVVREVVIQIKALLNDSRRLADDGIWRAILAEPPADQPHIRAAVAQELESQIRPMAENGSFPVPVVTFLGDWFGWHELKNSGQQGSDSQMPEQRRESQENAVDENSGQPDTNFWPAVVGWIVALAVLAVFFDNIFGG